MERAVMLFVACVDHDVEGIVLERLASRYRPGERSRDWRKFEAPAGRRRTPSSASVGEPKAGAVGGQ